jgi:hypothetical protein
MLNSFKIKKVIIYCIIILIIHGCEKDSPVSGNCSTCTDDECLDFVWPGNIIFEDYITTGPQYKLPFFNPLNGDEFVYVKVDKETSTFNYELIKHVISSGQETILCNSQMIIGQPQWGEQGVIIFTVIGNKIMKINDDGSGLVQVTPNGVECLNPIFEKGGFRFFVSGTTVSVNGNYFPIFDLNGIIVDSVKYRFGNNQISYPYCSDGSMKKGYYTYADINSSPLEISFCKLNNDESILSFYKLDMPNGLGLPHAICKNDKKLFFTQFQKGLFRLNLITGSVDKISSNCQSRYINSISISTDGNYIIYEQVKGVKTGIDQEIDEQSEIYMVNVNTCKKTKIIGE